jgi:hypothetical protein
MEITTTGGITDGETVNPSENDEQNDQQISGGGEQVEKGSGYGPPGEGSGETVPADGQESNGAQSIGGSEEDRAASLPGTTGGETAADSDSAGAGIDYGGTADDAGPITESTGG